MNYLSDKVTSLTGEALSGIDKLKRKRESQNHPAKTSADDEMQETTPYKQSANIIYGPKEAPLSQGFPFGGDSFVSRQAIAPAIGWRTDLLQPQDNQHSSQTTNNDGGQPARPGAQLGASEESLYEGDAWTRLWFQRVMILSLVRLMLFIRKVYEDFQATKMYNMTGQSGYFFVSAATLFLPTIIFTIYRVSRYLQLQLPTRRLLNQQAKLLNCDGNPRRLAEGRPNSTTKTMATQDEAQLRKALISSTLGERSNKEQSQLEDEGLVTARGTPTNMEDFHDTKSQQEPANLTTGEPSTSPAPSTVLVKDSPPVSKQTVHNSLVSLKESVIVDKLGDLPDKETTRIAIGASEQLLHGVLLIFWQLKRQVDVLSYLVERSCLWRKPRESEKEELDRMRTGSDGLEWFQDFYAAFLAILAQVYTLGTYWVVEGGQQKPLKSSTLESASSGIAGLAASDSTPDGAFSMAAKTLSDSLAQQAAVGNSLASKDLLIMSQLVVSSGVIFSLLIAVRRRDDGPLTLGLSMLGWGSIFASRIIIISLAFVHLGWKIMVPLVVCHLLGITCWIYKIALDSHNGKPGESEEYRWSQQADPEAIIPSDPEQSIELNESFITKYGSLQRSKKLHNETSYWSVFEHVILVAQIFTLFALPSLFYWPIMFNLKIHYRPFKYLVLIMTQNVLLILAIWLSISAIATSGQWYLLGAVGAFSISGFFFVSLYVFCKPSLTEYFARADEILNEAERSGIYFEFCSRVFKLPDLGKLAFKRLMNQTEQIVAEEQE